MKSLFFANVPKQIFRYSKRISAFFAYNLQKHFWEKNLKKLKKKLNFHFSETHLRNLEFRYQHLLISAKVTSVSTLIMLSTAFFSSFFSPFSSFFFQFFTLLCHQKNYFLNSFFSNSPSTLHSSVHFFVSTFVSFQISYLFAFQCVPLIITIH